eukprot:CAMPEP_0204561704 /NCGR_PEP_ID=MMETSP0661-20131031/33338_1 /ASSEMBLY_ACC=CAM_ASM_000606 /TAXON_ID=109239 /ORGANISM="Alexandrium margalefi, Strain AMGDE01CS-322" /LENGTH=297 /DNA_ID=CAMNT_0051569135 /DNA_START=54 /DNA_END=947 /DNA_ORIENTATION=+
MAQTEEKPSLPEGYKVPEVWAPPSEMGGTFGAINQPTAGPRTEEALPKGEHAIQLYSLGTPNGIKVTVLLEELGVEYDAWFIPIMAQKQFTSGFVSCNPNSKIPCMYDYNPDSSDLDAKAATDDPVRVFESGSILIYLAEKYGKFIPAERRKRTECLNWLMWQMGSAPMIGGGFGHFYKYSPIKIEYCINRFSMETKRLLDVLDQHLGGTTDGKPKDWVCGDEYTIADMAIAPWVRCIDNGYNAATFLGLEGYKHVGAWLARLGERKAFQRGRRVNGFSEDAVKERHKKEDFEAKAY